MKKTFLAKRNALLSLRGVSWGALALLLAIGALLVRLIAPNLFLHLLTPVFHASDTIALESHLVLTSFGDVATLTMQNEALATANTALATANQGLLKKIDSLSALLGAPDTAKHPASILAGVTTRPPLSPYDTLLLGAGAQDGVTPGMEAFGAGNVPIGVVSSVLADFSRVTLFSAPGATTSGWVKQNNIPITIVGKGGGAMTASVARVADVAVGDVVFVPGPGLLPIGSVARIDSDPSSPGVVVHIASTLNLFSVSWVELRTTGVLPVAFATSTDL